MTDDYPRRGPDDAGARDDQPPLVVLKLLDLGLYGLAVAVILVCVSAVVSFAFGAGWGGSKYLLFVVGFALFGLSALGMRPRGAWKDDEEDEDDSRRVASDDDTGLQAFVQTIPPLRRYELDPDDRLSFAAKLFVGSLFVLGASFVMEAVFGVRI